MKLYSIIVFELNELKIYKKAFSLSDISFFYRNQTKEILSFLSKTVAQSAKNQKLAVSEKSYMIYANSKESFSIVIIADAEYPSRVVFSLTENLFQQIQTVNLDQIIESFQDPSKADAILKIQQTINETKCIIIDSIDKALERGEKIDDLISKTNDLTQSSKDFYKEASKMNSCCVIA